MKRSLHDMSLVCLQRKQGDGDVSKKKCAKAQLKETQEELRKEKEAKEMLEEEKSNWTKERSFWIKEMIKMEELRQAEVRLSEVLRNEEVHKVNMEKDSERQKLLMDLEDMRQQRDNIERQKLEVEATWREAAESWVQKMSGMMDALEEKAEEIENLRRTVEERHKDAGIKKHVTGAGGERDTACVDMRETPLEKWKGWYSTMTNNRKTRWSWYDFSSLTMLQRSSAKNSTCFRTDTGL